MSCVHDSLYFYGEMLDLLLEFVREFYGSNNYPEYYWDRDPTLSKIDIVGPWKTDAFVVENKPKIVMMLGDFSYQSFVINNKQQEILWTYDQAYKYENVYTNLVSSQLRIMTLSPSWLESHRLAYITGFLFKGFREKIVTMSEGQIINIEMVNISTPALIESDSDTETFVTTTSINILMRERWSLVDDEYTYLNTVSLGYCSGNNDLSTLLLYVHD